jgi:uncharacterized membrane protein
MHDGKPSRPGGLPSTWLQPHKVFLAIASTLGLATLPNTVLYAPIAYLPQLAAVFLAKLLQLGPLLLLYVMRLAGFATTAVLGYAAIPLEIVTMPCFPKIPRLRPPDWLAAAVGITVGITGAVVCVSAVVTRFYLP